MAFFVLSFFPRDVLDEILNLIESVFEGFPTYFSTSEKARFSINKFNWHARRGNSHFILANDIRQ